MPEQVSDRVFVIMQVGQKESAERRRADEVYKYVIKDVVESRGLVPIRADLDASPGAITPKLLKDLVECRIVIADLTGRNPNVYYELGIAHSFAKPLVALADTASGLPFDNKDERVIELGEYPETGLPVSRVDAAKERIAAALDIILADGYDAPSPLKEVAGARSLDALAPSDPVAAELAQMRELLEDVRSRVMPRAVVPQSMRRDYSAMREHLVSLASVGTLSPDQLEGLITPETTAAFDAWVRDLQAQSQDSSRRTQNWAPEKVVNPWAGEEPPF